MLTAQELSGNTQIVLTLAHNTVNTSTITGSFVLLDNGTQTFTDTFTPTGHVFNSQTYTRAEIMTFSNDGVIVTGTAQQGQTLTAETATNDVNAKISYQWEELSSSSFTSFTDMGTNSATYQVQSGDVGDFIRVVALTGTDSATAQAATATSTATAQVTALAGQTDEWLNTAGGTWTDIANAATNWSDGALPRSIDAALIDKAGTYTVTIPTGETANAASITLNDANATLVDDGALSVASALIVDAGKLVIGSNQVSGITSLTNAGTVEFAASAGFGGLSNTGGTVQVDTGDTLTLNGAGIGSTATAGSGGTISIAANAAIADGGTSAIDNAVVNNSGSLVTGGTFTLDGDTINGGVLTGDAQNSSFNVDQNQTLTLNSVTVEAANGATAILNNAGAVTLQNGLTLSPLAIHTSTAFTLDITGSGSISMSAETISATGGSEVLENNGNTLSGAGQIGIGGGVLSLDNNAGTVEALGGTLTVDTGKIIVNASGATIEAAAGANSPIDDTAITNSGSGNIQVDGTLSLGNASQTLTLNGNGLLMLAGGVIDGLKTGETFENNGELINGFGQVGDGTDTHLSLNNAAGAIQASGGTLTIETGNTVTNAATLEAVAGATLQIDDAVTNTGLIYDFGTVTLNGDTLTNTGSGAVTLESTGSVLNLSGATVSGGTITDNWTLDVTGTSMLSGVTFEGNSSGAGTVDNSGIIKLTGGLTLAGTNFTLALDGAGTVNLNGQNIGTSVSGDTLQNNGNTIKGGGSIGSSSATPLNLDNASGTIEASGSTNTLVIKTGAPVTNANGATLGALTGATLQINSGSVNNSGNIQVNGTLAVDNPSTANGGNLKVALNDGGSVTLAGGTIDSNVSGEILANNGNAISGFGQIGDATGMKHQPDAQEQQRHRRRAERRVDHRDRQHGIQFRHIGGRWCGCRHASNQ